VVADELVPQLLELERRVVLATHPQERDHLAVGAHHAEPLQRLSDRSAHDLLELTSVRPARRHEPLQRQIGVQRQVEAARLRRPQRCERLQLRLERGEVLRRRDHDDRLVEREGRAQRRGHGCNEVRVVTEEVAGVVRSGAHDRSHGPARPCKFGTLLDQQENKRASKDSYK
jgi:hypothetical protein